MNVNFSSLSKVAQPIRLLLAYTETEYIDKRYNYGQTPEDQIEWNEAKYKLGLDFPNVSLIMCLCRFTINQF
jgi:hypothetical protein